jgi:hypothetical protein
MKNNLHPDFIFNCSICGHNECYRDEEMKKYCVSFWEGHFHCCNCDNEVYYASDDFKRIIITQTSLF